jgi:hypothetical protein
MTRFSSISPPRICSKSTLVRLRSTSSPLRTCANLLGTRCCRVDGRCKPRSTGLVTSGTCLVPRGMTFTRYASRALHSRIEIDSQTNVPTIRLAYRHATLLEELTLINHGRHSPSATPTHLKPSAGNAPPDRTLADSRPGITSRPSDVGAAAMAVTKAVQPSGGVPHLVGAASVLDERARKRSQTGLRAQAEKSAEIKN